MNLLREAREALRVGLRLPGGKLHVWRPGIRPITRCGLRVKPADVEQGIPVSTVDGTERCLKCFPGSGVKS